MLFISLLIGIAGDKTNSIFFPMPGEIMDPCLSG